MVGFREFGEEPLHFVLLQRHVDLDGGMAGDGGGNAPANLFQVQGLFFARDLIEQLVKHVLDRGRIHARRCKLHGDTAGAEGLGLEAVVLQFVGNLGKDGLLRRRQLEHDRHQQALALYFLRRALFQDAFKQHALVGYVLVDDP